MANETLLRVAFETPIRKLETEKKRKNINTISPMKMSKQTCGHQKRKTSAL